MQRASHVAVAVGLAGSCGSDVTLAWELPYTVGAALKRQKKKNHVISYIHLESQASLLYEVLATLLNIRASPIGSHPSLLLLPTLSKIFPLPLPFLLLECFFLPFKIFLRKRSFSFRVLPDHFGVRHRLLSNHFSNMLSYIYQRMGRVSRENMIRVINSSEF